MKKNYRPILYPLLALLIISGLSLFIFRNQLLDTLRAQENVVLPILHNAANEPVTLEIFKSPKFTALTNNVVNFDFDNICYRPSQGAVVSPAAANTSTTTATTTTDNATTTENSAPAALNCVRGNSLPFSLK